MSSKDKEPVFSMTAPPGVALYGVTVYVVEPSNWLKRLLWKRIFKGVISCQWMEIPEKE